MQDFTYLIYGIIMIIILSASIWYNRKHNKVIFSTENTAKSLYTLGLLALLLIGFISLNIYMLNY